MGPDKLAALEHTNPHQVHGSTPAPISAVVLFHFLGPQDLHSQKLRTHNTLRTTITHTHTQLHTCARWSSSLLYSLPDLGSNRKSPVTSSNTMQARDQMSAEASYPAPRITCKMG